MAPIRRGRIPGERRTYEERLRTQIKSIQDRVEKGIPNALNRVQSIHFGRLILIRPDQYLAYSEVDGIAYDTMGGNEPGPFPVPIDPYAGRLRSSRGDAKPAQTEEPTPDHGPDHGLDTLRSWLLVLVEFDGDPQVYFRDIADLVGPDFDMVLGNCEDFPGTGDFEPFWRWIRRFQLRADLFMPVYPDVSLVQIKALQAFRTRFVQFSAEVQAAREAGDKDVQSMLDAFLRETEQHATGFPASSGLFPHTE